ncbi:MAG: hypothetical protein H6Q71_2001, partial [Firmicutes bacterium]|nr:hypothetical protein [Bacillota bacterium]
ESQHRRARVQWFTLFKCEKQEEIPYQVVRDFDKRDLSYPPQFSCESCGGVMHPRYYKGVHGFEYRILDVLEAKGQR